MTHDEIVHLISDVHWRFAAPELATEHSDFTTFPTPKFDQIYVLNRHWQTWMAWWERLWGCGAEFIQRFSRVVVVNGDEPLLGYYARTAPSATLEITAKGDTLYSSYLIHTLISH